MRGKVQRHFFFHNLLHYLFVQAVLALVLFEPNFTGAFLHKNQTEILRRLAGGNGLLETQPLASYFVPENEFA